MSLNRSTMLSLCAVFVLGAVPMQAHAQSIDLVDSKVLEVAEPTWQNVIRGAVGRIEGITLDTRRAIGHITRGTVHRIYEAANAGAPREVLLGIAKRGHRGIDRAAKHGLLSIRGVVGRASGALNELDAPDDAFMVLRRAAGMGAGGIKNSSERGHMAIRGAVERALGG